LRDLVVLDHDVHGSARRCARSVDQDSAANDEAAEWAVAFTTWWRDARVAASDLDRLRRERRLWRCGARPLLSADGAGEEEERRDTKEGGGSHA
jgi:hypothetical protein